MWMILLALDLVAPDNSGPILIQALKDGSQPITARVTAANLLGKARNHAAVEPLCNIVRFTDNQHLKYNAISALGLIGDPNAKPAVEKELETVNSNRDFLIKVLDEIKEK
jgi:HEAT repeat protein